MPQRKFSLLKYPETLKVSARTLLFIASAVWFFAGGMLLSKGLSGIDYSLQHFGWILAFCIIAGGVFYAGMFSKISKKHVTRIKNMDGEKHPVYDFFNGRSYIMMFSMISLGVTLRLLNLFPFTYLAFFYIIMGIPLLISSFRFIYTASLFHK